MFNWEGVNEFVAVAELDSFTAASKRLAISTAQVSRQVSALEARLSTRLQRLVEFIINIAGRY